MCIKATQTLLGKFGLTCLQFLVVIKVSELTGHGREQGGSGSPADEDSVPWGNETGSAAVRKSLHLSEPQSPL